MFFALNATVPVFLTILLGRLINRGGRISGNTLRDANQYVFRIALPVSLFRSVAAMDIYADFSLSFFLFCALSTTVFFLGTWALSWKLLKDKAMTGAFSQAAVRSSAAILGLAFAANIYGEAGKVPMMIIACVPLFNIYSVLILTFSPKCDEEGRLLPPEGNTGSRDMIRRACLNVLKNPIILGVLAGVPFALLKIQLPEMLGSAVKSIASTATPIALLVVGASFSGTEALKKWKPAAAASVIKLFLLPMIFLPIAALCGFRASEMVAILIMTGSPATVSCYVMAKQMHGDGILTSNVILLTTLGSAFSITLWLFVLRSFALI